MPKPKEPNEEHARHEREEREQRERERHERRERPHGRGRERAVFLEYLAKRWTGSAPPTAEAYARALRQWRQLPGAVVTPATDVGTVQTPETGNGEEERKS
jgi:hypothetical protein